MILRILQFLFLFSFSPNSSTVKWDFEDAGISSSQLSLRAYLEQEDEIYFEIGADKHLTLKEIGWNEWERNHLKISYF